MVGEIQVVFPFFCCADSQAGDGAVRDVFCHGGSTRWVLCDVSLEVGGWEGR